MRALRDGLVAFVLVCGACATGETGTAPSTSPEGGADASTPIGTGDGGADAGADARSDAAVSPAGTKRIFATKAQFTGAFGGANSADAHCAAAATAAGLGGTWKAWISDGAESAAQRVGTADKWLLVDGKTIAFTTKTMSGLAAHDLDMDEFGATGEKGLAWTGTNNGGSSTSKNCSGWTTIGASGTAGYVGQPDKWTDDGTETPCNLKGRLYCVEQPPP